MRSIEFRLVLAMIALLSIGGCVNDALGPSTRAQANGTPEDEATITSCPPECEIDGVPYTPQPQPPFGEPVRRCEIGFDWDEESGQCVSNQPQDPGDGTPEDGDPNEGENPGGGSDPGDGDGDGDGDGETGPIAVNFSITCATVDWGESGGCSVAAPDSMPVAASEISYSWRVEGGSQTKSGTGAGFSAWSGTAVKTRTLTVDITHPEIEARTLSGTVTVSRRSWGRPRAEDMGDRSESTPDHCWTSGEQGPGALGLTFGRHPNGCGAGHFFALDGFDIAQVEEDDGPWEGDWYVEAPHEGTSEPGAYWAIHLDLRGTGTAHPTASGLPVEIRLGRCRTSANTRDVNLTCSRRADQGDDNTVNAFRDLVREVREHEQAHVNAVVAEAAEHNVWTAWESIVQPARASVRTAGQSEALSVQEELLAATLALDSPTNGRQSFEVW